MESDNSNFHKTSLLEKDVNLSRFRKRYNKLILIFKSFFISVTLIISALFIYLLASDSDQSIPGLIPVGQTFDPVIDTESQISLQRAAKELEDVASSIVYNYLGSNSDIATDFALSSCRRSLRNGSARIRGALETNPVSDNDERRFKIEIVNQLVVIKVEEHIKSCLDDLEKVGSTAAIEVREKVLRAKVYLSGRGDFLTSYQYIWPEILSAAAAAGEMVLENLFVVCLCGLQLLFISYLLLTVFKFR